MLDCWQKQRGDRPKFSAVVKMLDKFKLFPELLIPVAAPRYVATVHSTNERCSAAFALYFCVKIQLLKSVQL